MTFSFVISLMFDNSSDEFGPRDGEATEIVRGCRKVAHQHQ
jgi:hypothetical protein